ncbi:MAG: glycosyltransferase family 1 protein [Mariniblastus sp.]|nr:glycosyltransferase family 1 protein [Mariniblastus sp.]
MKKILINCLSARSGGAISYLNNAISKILLMGKARENVEFFGLCDSNQASALDAHRELILQAPTANFGGLKRSLWERKNLPKLIKGHGFSTVFTPYQVQNFSSKAKSVLMLRNMEPFCFDQFQYGIKNRVRNHALRFATIRSMQSADHIIAVSGFAKDKLQERCRVSDDRVSHIYHGRDTFFSADIYEDKVETTLQELNINRPFLLTCGSLLPYRRCEDVIEAFVKYIASNGPTYDLVVAGDSNDSRYKNKLHRLANESGQKSRVHFVGHVSKESIRALYRSAKIVILATEIEACPNIAIEAMSAGAVILASNSRPLPEIIGQGNALFFEQRNIDQIHKQLQFLTESKKEAAELRQCAQQRAFNYSWDRCVEKTLTLLERI